MHELKSSLSLLKPWKTRLIRLALDAIFYTRVYRLLESELQGVGVIFTLHHVLKNNQSDKFAPNSLLEITPEFLEQTIKQVLSLGYDTVTLDEVQRRLTERDFGRKFVCFTLDDGYIDNYQNAFSVFKKYNVPFTLYVATSLPDGTANLWWRSLEQIVQQEDSIELQLGSKEYYLATDSTQKKYRAFDTIYWLLRGMPLDDQRASMNAIVDRYKIDTLEYSRSQAISWDMLREMSESGLATIGSHTVNHFALSKLSPDQVRDEATLGRKILAEKLNIESKHFAYPYGDKGSASQREMEIIRALGFQTATTTRKGVLFEEHAEHLHALPRIPLNGYFQHKRFVRLFLSGVPTALWQGFRRLDVE